MRQQINERECSSLVGNTASQRKNLMHKYQARMAERQANAEKRAELDADAKRNGSFQAPETWGTKSKKQTKQRNKTRRR